MKALSSLLSEDGYMPAGLVKQYAYCPTIPWIIARHGYAEPPTASMMQARELTAEEKEEIARRIGLPEPIRIEVPLHDPQLRVRGVADAVAGSRKLTVAEIKAYPRRRYDHFTAQLKVYALLAEKTLGPVHRAILVMNGRIVLDLPVTDRVLREAERLVQKTWKTILSPHPPIHAPDPRKCASCGYRRLCPNQGTW